MGGESPAASFGARFRQWEERHPHAAKAGRLLATALGFALLLWFVAWVFRPEMAPLQAAVQNEPWPDDVARPIPDIAPDPAQRLRLQVDVDYSAGPRAPWFPKTEAPILAALVSQGKLPPVAERTGPEPCVYKPVDGIGVHGGTWVVSGGDPEQLMYRMTACTLLRWSPQGHPLVPHVAKEWTHSDDWRTFTFTLRRGTRWSDGQPFTAHDIVFWWEQEMNCPETGYEVPDFMRTRGRPGTVRADGDLRVIFEFAEPYGLFPECVATAWGGIAMVNAPAHYLRPYHPVLGDRKLIEETKQALHLSTDRELYQYMKQVSNTEHPRLWPWLYRTWKSGPPYSFVRNP